MDSLKDANTKQAITDIVTQAVSGFASVTSAGGTAAWQQRPFVLLSLLLVLVSVAAVVLCMQQKRSRKQQIFVTAAAALALLIFALTTGFGSFAFANWWTLAVGAPAVAAVIGFWPKAAKATGPN